MQLKPNDVVVFVSDGFEDCLDADGESFGRERLKGALRVETGDPQTVAESLLGATDRWAGKADIADDRTVVVVRVVG